MKKMHKFLSLVLVVVLAMSALSVVSFAAKEKESTTEPKTEIETFVFEMGSGAVDEAKFVLYVGKEFAGRHFQLETDAGVYPQAYTVSKDGYIEFYFETGASSKFELTLLDNREPVVQSSSVVTKESEETVKDQDNKKEESKKDVQKKDIVKKIAAVVVVLVIVGCGYFVACKKTGTPLFKKKK